MKTSGYTRQNIAKIKGRRERPIISVEAVTNLPFMSFVRPISPDTLFMPTICRILPVKRPSSAMMCKGLNMSPKSMTRSQTGAVSPIKNMQPSWNEILYGVIYLWDR